MNQKKTIATRTKTPDLVGYSRAGDIFHYRWAARRCLRLIYPKSMLHHVVIEGSDKPQLPGEYVIDVSEYTNSTSGDFQEIEHYQLKHTTVRKKQPFRLSDLKNTLSGFAKRYKGSSSSNDVSDNSIIVAFTVVTNRTISATVKENIESIATGGKVNNSFSKTIKKYTKLAGKELAKFCSLLKFVDGEGDYDTQRFELKYEIAQLLAGAVDTDQVDGIVALVQDKVLPHSDGRVDREDVLKRFGVTSEKELYPAPAEFEKLNQVIPRKQHNDLYLQIINASTSIIIHAEGGVGKSVFARQVVTSLPKNSLGIVYDCFGAGRYRSRSELRHRHRDALVQISNELASRGLCSPLMRLSTDLEDEILRAFLSRVETAIQTLRRIDKAALLVILIDAADNAEMAAKEYSENCFVHELLRESMPDGCRLVMLCRTERLDHLLPPASTIKLKLEQFSEEESLIHLRGQFPDATQADGLEFHRLSNNGNPRIQANALGLDLQTIDETLERIGPGGTTVEKQIEAQLDSAVSLIRDKLPDDYKKHIDAICYGLANLPPFIPIKVLAAAAQVDESTIKSFIVDLGRPLWLSDAAVHFRDEPTETWFREKFSASPTQIETYIGQIEPLALEYPYVAETLPALYLNAEKYRELIDLALSDNLLPEGNPIDVRSVRVYRLQFAFKAALKSQKYADATKLAFRAGEEVAGDKRQLELLRSNVDLIAPLQYEQKVQDLAFRRLLRSKWEGSENVYSAALLSSVENFKGEARGYLRASVNWLQIYFETRDKEKEKENNFQELLTVDDIVELAFSHFNLHGIDKLVDFVFSWKPPELVYSITQKFFRRLIDANNLVPMEEASIIAFRKQEVIRGQYLMIAAADELLEIGRVPNQVATRKCLNLLASKKTQIPQPTHSNREIPQSAILSFIEACVINKHSKEKILRVLNHYFPLRASRSVGGNHQTGERDIYLRALALRCVLKNELEPDFNKLFPKEFIENKKKKNKTQNYQQERNEFKDRVGGLLPWYLIRARILVQEFNDLPQAAIEAERKSKKANEYRYSDSMPYEVFNVLVEIATLYQGANTNEVKDFFTNYLKNNKQVRLPVLLKAVRNAFRSHHLSGIRRELEISARELIFSLKDESPETKAEWYIDLARAVFAVSTEDAASYFTFAIDAVSRFGDELAERWGAIVAIAKRSTAQGHLPAEIAYRFIRCAELVGENVGDEDRWNRNETIRTNVRMSPESAFAALSRWRDREIGWFERQLPALANEIVTAEFVSPTIGWSLAAFFDDYYYLSDFASLCIARETSRKQRQIILDTAVRYLRLNEAGEESLRRLKTAADQHHIINSDLDESLIFYAAHPEKDENIRPVTTRPSKRKKDENSIDWERIFDGLELATPAGISQAIQRFKTIPKKSFGRDEFWQVVFKRVDEHNAVKLLQAVIAAENVDRYDIQDALSSLPEDWHQKVSIKKSWGNIIERAAQRLALELMPRWSLKYFLEKVPSQEDILPNVRQGILQGLSSNTDLEEASTFFGFVEVVAPIISPEEATTILNFALTRLELHIDAEFGDGPWADWLNPPQELSRAFTGFIWSALGSPRSEIRWRAAHCVRRLAEFGCNSEINFLIDWMTQDIVEAFGSQKFPFYNLNARQYLLIAFARISIDKPEVLGQYSSTFSRIALTDMPHIIMQKLSATIALNIENKFPNTYNKDTVEQLKKVGVSQLPKRELKRYGDHVDSYLHEKKLVDSNLEDSHGWDFDRYWFEPLGRVFGVSEKQISQLASQVIVKDWKVSYDGSYAGDPRVQLWQSNQDERETWHDHGSYPRVERYSYYLSYHSMFVVASNLLDNMPLVHRQDSEEDTWNDWFLGHYLTRSDGGWLADRRDPAPLLKPNLREISNDKAWLSQTKTVDALNTILFDFHGETWVRIYGSWEESESERRESYHVYSALASPLASQSLLNLLANSQDPYDHGLPVYKEEEMEFTTPPFELQGWVGRNFTDNNLDRFDPFAAEIAFPPCEIGRSFAEKLGIVSDLEKRQWFISKSNKLAIVSELWKTNKSGYNKDPLRDGERLSAPLSFLRMLCAKLEFEIIFKVQIDRKFTYDSYAYRKYKSENGHSQPYQQIFLLSADGKLRTTETSYQLRE